MSDSPASRRAFYRSILLAGCLACTASIASPEASADPFVRGLGHILHSATRNGNESRVAELLERGVWVVYERRAWNNSPAPCCR